MQKFEEKEVNMKYETPKVVKVNTPTAVIAGGKDSMHQDSNDPNNPQSASTGYPADE
jgi:hypothetical protein